MDEEIRQSIEYIIESYQNEIKENKKLMNIFPFSDDLGIRMEEQEEFIDKLQEVIEEFG